jgi:hypothetical protein
MTEFSIDFGKAKTLELPPEGNYRLIISDYMVKQAKNESSRANGFNISLVFNVDDPEYPGMRVYHNLWVQYENPWAAKFFFEALTGKTLGDDSLDVSDPDMFIGDSVGASLIHENYTANNGVERTKLVVAAPEAFYSV